MYIRLESRILKKIVVGRCFVDEWRLKKKRENSVRAIARVMVACEKRMNPRRYSHIMVINRQHVGNLRKRLP